MRIVRALWDLIRQDRRPQREIERERTFIRAANRLKTLRVTPEGAMFIDPEEFREQIVCAREQLKHLVPNPEAPGGPYRASENHRADQGADFAAEASVGPMECMEVVAWRRLYSGAVVRYMCLQSIHTGMYAVATATMISKSSDSLSAWIDGDTTRQVACALQGGEFHWCLTISDAMDAWDAEL